MIEYLAFSGGGMKGFAYIGVLKALEEHGIIPGIKEIAGTSIGAFFGFMVTIGWTASELERVFMATDLAEHTDISLKSLFESYGLDDGSKLELFMENLISQKGLHPHVTFHQLAWHCSIELHVVVTNLNKQCRMVLNALETPDLRVVDAVRMSMAVPAMFAPGTLNGNIIADGGLSCNLPACLFEDKPRDKVLGFYLRGCPPEIPFPIENFPDYILAAMTCVLRQVEECEWHRLSSQFNIVPVFAGMVSTLDPVLTGEQKREAIQSGHDSFQHFWNDTYKEQQGLE